MQGAARCEIAAIASRDDGARARGGGAASASRSAYGSYEELLADPDIEAIYNPLPNELHVPWTIKALEAGKHVLCEKPIALTPSEAQPLIAARDRPGRLVAEAFMVRFHPQWRRARELAQSGAIGEVAGDPDLLLLSPARPDNIRNRPPGGGGLYDIGCYAILTARYIFGDEPTRVVATIDRDPDFGTDRLASALLEFPGGRHLTFACATQIAPHQRVTIAGDKGPDRDHDPVQRAAGPADADHHRRGADLSAAGARVEEFAVCDQYALQGDAFSRAVRGEAPLEFPIEDAIANMRVIDALFRSAERGRLGDAVAPRPACVAFAPRPLRRRRSGAPTGRGSRPRQGAGAHDQAHGDPGRQRLVRSEGVSSRGERDAGRRRCVEGRRAPQSYLTRVISVHG